jgi:hypothetical protein
MYAEKYFVYISLEGWVHSLILASITLIVFDEQCLQVQNGLYNMTLVVVLKLLTL